MKILITFLIFLLTSIVPCAIIYLVFDGLVQVTLLSLYVVAWLLINYYLDKFILVFLKAREIMDTDRPVFYQAIKNQAYKNHTSEPKVYLYSGSSKKCFVIESGGRWSIVLDRNLVSSMGQSEIFALIDYLYRYRKTGHAWIQTMVLGAYVVTYSSLNWILDRLLFFVDSNNPHRALNAFFVAMLRPLYILLEKIGMQKISIKADVRLQGIAAQQIEDEKAYQSFLLGHLNKKTNFKQLLTNYLEGYPVLENCTFENEF